jgi:hypothetical protein
VSIEADDGGRRPRIPNSNASICVTHGEDVWVNLAPADGGDLISTAGITPPAQQLARLDIPAENLFVGGGVCASGSGGLGAWLSGGGGPDNVRSRSRDYAKSVALLVLAEWALVEG